VAPPFEFVTDGIESALAQAKYAAQDKDVWLVGGASVSNQYLAAGLVDEIDLSIAPVVIGGGERLFEGLEHGSVKLTQIRAVDAPGGDPHQVRGRLNALAQHARHSGGRVC
jgi:dihydrofolate reductase